MVSKYLIGNIVITYNTIFESDRPFLSQVKFEHSHFFFFCFATVSTVLTKESSDLLCTTSLYFHSPQYKTGKLAKIGLIWDALCDFVSFAQLKKAKNTHGGVLLLVKLH